MKPKPEAKVMAGWGAVFGAFLLDAMLRSFGPAAETVRLNWEAVDLLLRVATLLVFHYALAL
jgi:hypothetical protein